MTTRPAGGRQAGRCSRPAGRPVFKAGTLSAVGSGGEACTPINFDPNVLSAGFSAGADPILRMRSPAYAISFGQRLSGQ